MSDEDVMGQGVVNTYDSFKGFGFIRRDKGRDVFFFYDDIDDGVEGLVPGEIVRFQIRIEAKGPRAYKIKRIG
ncbi:retron Se72 family effector protein [Pseudomonas putida]|uniref:retron Se72 family effector protein n=1 Tax=Pseudomonas putida TaxID=303 RepID=UPI000950CEC1|nr:retron Se72 family effector protein [Pseudomonas putida]